MNKILEDFKKYYASLESLLNEACMKANKEGNADILQAITDLHETAKFIEVDADTFLEILSDINNYVSKENEELD